MLCITFRVCGSQTIRNSCFFGQRAKLFPCELMLNFPVLYQKGPVNQISQIVKTVFYYKNGIAGTLELFHDFGKPLGGGIVQIG